MLVQRSSVGSSSGDGEDNEFANLWIERTILATSHQVTSIFRSGTSSYHFVRPSFCQYVTTIVSWSGGANLPPPENRGTYGRKGGTIEMNMSMFAVARDPSVVPRHQYRLLRALAPRERHRDHAGKIRDISMCVMCSTLLENSYFDQVLKLSLIV